VSAGIERPVLLYGGLRRYALYSGVKLDFSHDVVDHDQRTRVEYLARCLPKAALHELAAEAQDDMVRSGTRSYFAEQNAAALLDAVEAGTTLDMAVNVCASGGQTIDDATTPCSLGLAACFVCPNGYRTQDHIPGLIALAEFTAMIRDYNPTEWIQGDASALHTYATETLKRFPDTLIHQARHEPQQHESNLLTVAHLYTEFRR